MNREEEPLPGDWPQPTLLPNDLPQSSGETIETSEPPFRTAETTGKIQPNQNNQGTVEPLSDAASTLLQVINLQKQITPNSQMPTMINLQEGGLRRSAQIQAAKNLISCFTYFSFGTCASEFEISNKLEENKIGTGFGATFTQRILAKKDLLEQNIDGTQNILNPVSQCFSSLADNETYNFKEAMEQEDSADFVLAMLKEIKDHEDRKHWVYCRRAELRNVQTIMAIRSFKRKRAPDGRLLKHKAMLCAHGGQQRWGVNYWETYFPVVNWMSARLMLIISIIHDLLVRSVDFVLAFP